MTDISDASPPPDRNPLANFGGDETWRARRYRPADEQQLLTILARHARGQIRALGAGHSWSDVLASPDVTLDMGAFGQFETHDADGDTIVRAGAGLRLQEVIDRLHAQTGRTLPTLGAIKRQTVAGAISTGTHGSGKPSFSHFVTAVRLAAYDPATGQPAMFEHREGDALKASRCALGCTGAIVSVDLRTVEKYAVEETVTHHVDLASVLARYPSCPLTQFVLVPYRWDFVAWERRPVERRRRPRAAERVKAWLFRLHGTVSVDVLFHLLLQGALRLGGAASRALMRAMPHLMIKNVARIDDDEHVLTLGHHYFRHEEMELFVKQSRLADALDLLRHATQVFAGDDPAPLPGLAAALHAAGLVDSLARERGRYVQHYPFLIRRLLPDDTLISMGSALEEPAYSISVFTYWPPGRRDAYYAFCAWLATAMNRMFDARLHWGKHFPLCHADIARLYPHLETFARICRESDPHGVFRNDFTGRVLRLPPGGTDAHHAGAAL